MSLTVASHPRLHLHLILHPPHPPPLPIEWMINEES